MVFVIVLRTSVPFDKETLADMKYKSEKYVSIIGCSCADKVSSSDLYRKFCNSSYLYSKRRSLYLDGTVYEAIAEVYYKVSDMRSY